MPICLAAGAAALILAGDAFTLDWMHSVERTRWQEDWRVADATLVLDEARVQGSGAGMDPAADAVLEGGFWRWPGHGLSVRRLVLARSGATGEEWSICIEGDGCHSLNSLLLSEHLEPVEIRPC